MSTWVLGPAFPTYNFLNIFLIICWWMRTLTVKHTDILTFGKTLVLDGITIKLVSCLCIQWPMPLFRCSANSETKTPNISNKKANKGYLKSESKTTHKINLLTVQNVTNYILKTFDWKMVEPLLLSNFTSQVGFREGHLPEVIVYMLFYCRHVTRS